MLMSEGSLRERVLHALPDAPIVLAVSGGADSMVLVSAVLGSPAAERVVAVAAFDHGTGAAASTGVELASALARAHGVAFRTERGVGIRPSEAAWRAARWGFLTRIAGQSGARIVTAHTEDDQAETVFIRLLRGSGVRGLAGLLAPGAIVRPMLSVSRGEVRQWARQHDVGYVDDPSNTDLRFLRNRVRLELLPRLESAEPGFRAWLLDLGERAAALRAGVASAVDRHWAPVVEGASARIPRQRTHQPTYDEAALFWPEVAGRIGVALDRRGTARVAAFTTKRIGGKAIPLAGGAVVRSERAGWIVSAGAASATTGAAPADRRAPREG